MFCYRCKSVAVGQRIASCECQQGHRFYSLSDLNLTYPWHRRHQFLNDRAAAAARQNMVTMVVEFDIQQELSSLSFFKRVKRSLFGLKNDVVGIVLCVSPPLRQFDN